MNKFKINDNVTLNSLFDPTNYGRIWENFWNINKITIFSIHANSMCLTSLYNKDIYLLQYPNGKVVMNPINNDETAIFFDHELELYIPTNLLPDHLFEL